MTNEFENNDSSNVEEVEEVEEVSEATDEPSDGEDSPDVSELQRQLEALKNENKTLKIQKAKAKEKVREVVKTEPRNEMPQSDLIALMKADIHEDDIQEVVDYAKFKNIPVKDALSSSTIKALLSEKTEKRKSAEVSNTGATRKSTAKMTDEALVSKFSKGEMPDSDEELTRLIEKQFGK